MNRTAILLLPFILIAGCSKTPAASNPPTVQETQKDDQYRKELDEIRQNIKGEVKIKLKRDGKSDAYSWEISGKDANEVLKANDILSRKLAPK